MAALQHGDGGIEHHGGIDLALLHRRHRGGAEADADHRRAGRIEAVLLQQIFQEEIGRGTRRADADLLAGQILDRLDLAGVRRRHHQHQPGIAVIDHEGLQFLLLGGQIDAMVEIAGHHVGAAAEHGLQRVRAALEVDQFDGQPGLFVFAELLGQHGRQIAQAGAAADRDRDLALRCGKSRGQRQRQQRAGQPAEQFPHGFLQFVGRQDSAARGLEKATSVPSDTPECKRRRACGDLFHRERVPCAPANRLVSRHSIASQKHRGGLP